MLNGLEFWGSRCHFELTKSQLHPSDTRPASIRLAANHKSPPSLTRGSWSYVTSVHVTRQQHVHEAQWYDGIKTGQIWKAAGTIIRWQPKFRQVASENGHKIVTRFGFRDSTARVGFKNKDVLLSVALLFCAAPQT